MPIMRYDSFPRVGVVFMLHSVVCTWQSVSIYRPTETCWRAVYPGGGG